MLRRSPIAAYTLLTLALAVSGACSSPEPTAAPPPIPQPQSSRQAPPREQQFVIAPDLPPLPAYVVANSGQSPDLVRAVHLFAARHPEVLSYMPCFCGCQRGGHKHNDDCFVAARDGTGKVTAWEPHGVG